MEELLDEIKHILGKQYKVKIVKNESNNVIIELLDNFSKLTYIIFIKYDNVVDNKYFYTIQYKKFILMSIYDSGLMYYSNKKSLIDFIKHNILDLHYSLQ